MIQNERRKAQGTGRKGKSEPTVAWRPPKQNHLSKLRQLKTDYNDLFYGKVNPELLGGKWGHKIPRMGFSQSAWREAHSEQAKGGRLRM